MKALKQFGLACLIGCLVQTSAYGQDDAATNAATNEDKALPTRTKAGLVIEEVIVTVSKRSESLQDVMGSVTALSGEALKRNNVQDFSTLADLIPSMITQNQAPDQDDNVTIRGISRTRDGASPVAFHINDMFTNMRGEPYYDLAAIEVVRGPSGIVFGRNATAGAINAKWRRPEATWAIGGDARISDLDEEQLRAYLNVPLLGEDDRRLLARFAAVKRRRGGSLDNLLVGDGKDPGNINDNFFRVYLTSEPTDFLQLGLRAVRYQSDPRGAAQVFSPSLATRRSGVLEELGAQPLPDDLRKVRSRADETSGEVSDDFVRVAGDVTWSLQDLPLINNVDVVLIGGVVDRDTVSVFDLDGTEEPLLDGRTELHDDIRRSAELRFVSQNNSGIDWLAGLFWHRRTVTKDRHILVRQFVKPSTLGFPALPGEPDFPVNVKVDTIGERILDKSQAIFGNVNLDFSRLLNGGPHIELTMGLRYNEDEFTLKTASNDIVIISPVTGEPIPVVEERDAREFADFGEQTGEIGARWFYSDAGMAYLKFSRGYKPGLAQRVESPSGIIQNPVDPEFINAWEAGWKTSFFDQSLVLNLSAYRYDYRDLQVSQITPGGVVTDNAASATINGVEADVQWSPTAALSLQAGISYLDTTYDQFCASDEAQPDAEVQLGCTDKNPLNLAGERLKTAPEFAAVLLASYTFDWGDLGTLTPSLKTNWMDKMDRRGLGDTLGVDTIPAHSNTDIRLTWESVNRTWKVEGFVERIEDHDDIFFEAFTPIAGRPRTFTLAGDTPPRIVGVLLEVAF